MDTIASSLHARMIAHNSIAAQLKEHSITRRYQAIVHGALRRTMRGVIDEPIGEAGPEEDGEDQL